MAFPKKVENYGLIALIPPDKHRVPVMIAISIGNGGGVDGGSKRRRGGSVAAV
jgi:hypothetical protein